MHKIFTLAMLLALGCAKPAIKQQSELQIGEKLTSFFEKCEQDMLSAADVIAEKNLIKNLSHLNKMDAGGMRFYSLEKEAISGMINAISVHPYSQCFLTNKSGIIIYSMRNNEMLGKTVSSFPMSPLPELFSAASAGEKRISDITVFPAEPNVRQVYFSVPVKVSGEIQGSLIASVEIIHMMKNLPPESFIVNGGGVILFHNQANLIMTEDADFNANGKRSSFPNEYYKFAYRNIQWFIAVVKN